MTSFVRAPRYYPESAPVSKFPYWGPLPDTQIERSDLNGLMMMIRPGFSDVQGNDRPGAPPLNYLEDKSPLEFPETLYDLTPKGRIPQRGLTKDDSQTLFFFFHYIRHVLPMVNGSMTAGTKIVVEKQTVKGQAGYYFALLVGPFDPFSLLDVQKGQQDPGYNPMAYSPFTDTLGQYISDYVTLYTFVLDSDTGNKSSCTEPCCVRYKYRHLYLLLANTDIPAWDGKRLINHTIAALATEDIHKSMRETEALIGFYGDLYETPKEDSLAIPYAPGQAERELRENHEELKLKIDLVLRKGSRQDVHREALRVELSKAAQKAQPKISNFFVTKKQQNVKHTMKKQGSRAH